MILILKNLLYNKAQYTETNQSICTSYNVTDLHIETSLY